MLNNVKTSKKEQGFTIIEVLIVLAIAGLILLIVFLAVPALQRNQRNTSRRSEASRIVSAANDTLTNSNGQLPMLASDGDIILKSAGVSATTSLQVGTGAGATTSPATACSAVAASPAAGTLTVCAGANPTAFAPSGNRDFAILGTGVICNGTSQFTAAGAATRSMALIYTLEAGSSGRILACVGA